MKSKIFNLFICFPNQPHKNFYKFHPDKEVLTAYEIHFMNSVEAITPGQSAVFYEGDDVVGGGWIKDVKFL